MADRYTYLPSIGIAIMLVWGMHSFIRNENIRKKLLTPGYTDCSDHHVRSNMAAMRLLEKQYHSIQSCSVRNEK